MNAMTPWQRIRPSYLALAAVVAAVQLRVIHLEFGRQYNLSVEAAQGVLDGLPHWRVFQNRLLGPYLVEAFSAVTDSFEAAHALCTFLLLSATGYVVLRAVTRRRLRLPGAGRRVPESPGLETEDPHTLVETIARGVVRSRAAR